MTATTSNSNIIPGLDTLEVLGVPKLLNRDDHPYVPYWTELQWIAHCNRQRDLGRIPSRLGFLTDGNGHPLSESMIRKFMSHAKNAWNELYRHRLDPISWTKKTPRAASYFTKTMMNDFPEFCYCEDNWKVERFAIVKYPDWCRDSRDSGCLIRAFHFLTFEFR